jgi:hypothetical protein
VLGRLLGGIIGAVLLVRRPRPIHSVGEVSAGELAWIPARGERSGIRWIDDVPSAAQAVTARMSRAIGLPRVLPDVLGLALRVETPEGDVDLNLSTTGFDFPGRFTPVLHRSLSQAWFGSLMPYRGTRGPVLIAARLRGSNGSGAERVFDLFHAGVRGKWRRFAEVRLSEARGDRDDLRFDPLHRPPPGAATYEWARLLREPGYRIAQRSRPGSGGRSGGPG